MSPGQSLRSLITQGHCIAAPGAYDPLTATVLASLGFEALYLGGNAIGLQMGVGQPFVTSTETAAAVRGLRRVTDLPILVDAATGFGDPVHGLLACQEIERAGAAGLHLDDQVFPKRAHYHKGVGRLVSADEFATRIEAAARARIDPSFVVVARTDALRVTRSVDQTIERLLLCRQHGADAAMVLDLGPEQAAEIRRALPDLPLIWIGGISEPVPTLTELQQAGFCLATYPFNTVAAVMQATHAAWADFALDGRPQRPAEPTTQWVQRAMALIGMDRMWAIEARTTERPSAPVPPIQTKQGTSK